MKKILFVLFVAVVTLTSCDYDWPLDNDQYPQKVYIVGAHEKILYKSLDLSYDKDTVTMSLGVSGSLSLSKDVMTTICQDSAAVMKYNDREWLKVDILISFQMTFILYLTRILL